MKMCQMGAANIAIGGKQYSVRVMRAYTNTHGEQISERIEITTQWETVMPCDVFSVRPRMIYRSASISPNGKLGKKVLKAAALRLEA